VKVLDIDIARKRISLTLRLDDEATPGRSSRPAKDNRGDRRSQPPAPGRGRGGPTADESSNTALADALRRAGLTE
jgi:uncharacterized protein